MGGLTSAVHWWEEWQLRVLVLTSLAIQFFLLCFPFLRVRALPGWFRFIMWLAYHGSDAVAIYALATLFNRHKDQGDGSSNTLLEVVWAPVLLIHLGGCGGVTAYNIEDNELWSRHLLTAVSQITVAVYVFCKSWPPGSDKRLLQAAILLFISGVFKCFFKALAFKRASIYNLVSSAASAAAAANQTNDCNMCNELEKFVKHARGIVVRQEPEDHQVVETDPRPRESQVDEVRCEVSKLFVDLSSPYSRRIITFKKFWGIREERAHAWAQAGLSSAFLFLYTKLKGFVPDETSNDFGAAQGTVIFMGNLGTVLPWASIGLFHHSHREAYNDIDVKVTYAILCCTAVLEAYSIVSVTVANFNTILPFHDESYRTKMTPDNILYDEVWPETVAQYSLAGYFVRNKKHSIMMGIVSFLQCKNFLDQLWCMEPCSSSARITHLVLGYLEDGWKKEIKDAATYRSFNNHCSFRNHCTFNKHCRNRPFDESILIWHLATEFCFFSTWFPDHRCAFPKEPEPGVEIIIQGASKMVPAVKSMSVAKNPTTAQCSQESAECKAVQCRQMSNYMVYLLFVNPEMLLPGTRRNLFKTAHGELKDILNLKDWKWNPVCWSRCTPCVGVKLIEEEAIVMDRLILIMQKKTLQRVSQEESSEEAVVTGTSQEESSMNGSNKEEKFIDEAWDLAQGLLEMGEKQMWEEIQGVWVEMLCFSASRCRGYLHAKALGKGGEFLSYVWLLLFYMGMETFSERLQRELLPGFQGNFHNGTTPTPASEVSTTGAGAPSASEVHTHAGAGAAPSASEVHTHAGAGAAPSTSEISIVEDNMV